MVSDRDAGRQRTRQVTVLKQLLDVCHEARRVTETLPALPEGLSARHLKVLDVVGELSEGAGAGPEEPSGANEPHAACVSDVASYLGVTRPGITRVMAQLQRRGLVHKTPDPTDGRVVRVSLTEEGRAMRQKLVTDFHCWLAQQIGPLDAEAVESVERAVGELTGVLARAEVPLPIQHEDAREEGDRHDG